MGLDAVELVMDVEDHFGITIADREAEQLRTVGDLVTLIRGRIAAAESSKCFAMLAFLLLRAVIRDVAADQTMRMKPSDAVVDRLSAAERRRLWLRLPDLLGSSPRSLRRPKPVGLALAIISVALVVGAVALSAAIDWATLPLTLLVALLLVAFLLRITSRLRHVPPDGYTTLGQITLKMVGLSAAMKKHDLPDDDAILAELTPIIVEVLGVDRKEVVLDARFVEDLGVG